MIRVAVVGGGKGGEHEVSLKSAASASKALDRGRYEVIEIIQLVHGGWLLDSVPVTTAQMVDALAYADVTLPLIHGAGGEDGTLAALCELAGTPYVGSGIAASAIGMDKQATKLLASSIGLRTARGTLLRRGQALDESALPWHPWQGPVVVKPADAGSSVGVTWVSEASGMGPALDAAFAWSDRVLVEERIVGREIDIAVFAERGGLVVSAPLEIAKAGNWDYEAKYNSKQAVEELFTIPAPLTESEGAALAEQATRLYRALNARGVARFDFFLDAGGWVLNEVNTIPGMTSQSQVPLQYAALGIEYPELLDRLIDQALWG